MKTSTKNLIIVIILLVTVVAAFSVVSGIDFEYQGGSTDTEPAGECTHQSHDKNGNCKTCGEVVGHDYTISSGKFTSIGNGKHNTSFYCSGSCGSFEGAIQTCVYVNGICSDCGYNVTLAQSCSHSKHDENGMCKNCGSWVGHTESLIYTANGDNTHTVSYSCATGCGYGGVSEPIGCTFSNGTCLNCGATACSHTTHDNSGDCIACGYNVGHDYVYTYEKISGDDLYHNYSGRCAVCNKISSGKGSHFYNGDYTCDKCGHTYVE